MEIAEFIYKGIVEHSYTKLLGYMPPGIVSEGYRDQNTPCQILTPDE